MFWCRPASDSKRSCVEVIVVVVASSLFVFDIVTSAKVYYIPDFYLFLLVWSKILSLIELFYVQFMCSNRTQ